MPKLIDLAGQRFHRLLVIGLADRQGTTPRWRCICDCGNETLVIGSSLRFGKQQSCGCWKKERTIATSYKHGSTDTTEYAIWSAMKYRCDPLNSNKFKNHAGRGIVVCERWSNSFELFLLDMGKRPSKNHSIDRINNDLGYSPENCRWATQKEQASNTRRNIYVKDGNDLITVAEWSRRHKVCASTVYGRIRRGDPFDQDCPRGPRSSV